MPSLRAVLTGAIAAVVFAGSWFFRFNDPSGSFAGLTDDHFFYLVRGWQILYGDVPVRDFVDHGAPLYYYAAAAVQVLAGRGTAPEIAFSVTLLSLAAALTFWLAARASGSLLAGAAAALFHILLEPRFYNYPKVLVYAIGIPLIWRFADRPVASRAAAVAAWTVVAFLFRHDHGVFMAVGAGTMLLALEDVPARERLRQCGVYAGLTALMAAPYLLFIQLNGGIVRYFDDASTWAAKDRRRAPVVWPGLFDDPGGLAGNIVAWLYYVELLLPFIALALVAVSRQAFRPSWRRAMPKIISVAALAVALNAGFLRSPLVARLADPSVPHAILLAWLATAAAALLRSREGLRERLQPYATAVRVGVVLALLPFAVVIGTSMTFGLGERVEKAYLLEGPSRTLERSVKLVRQFEDEWRLVHWMNRDDRPELMELSFYLNTCTAPDDRIFVQPYIPQVIALARRAFAGGHADLRPGFFTSPDAQELTLERLRRQPVPVALLESSDAGENFRKSFPAIAAHFDREYVRAGTHVFDGRFGVQLLVRRDRVPTGRDRWLGWPCFR